MYDISPLTVNSLVEGQASDLTRRRMVKDLKAAMAAPSTATDGVPCKGAGEVVLVANLPDTGTSLDLTAWAYDEEFGTWSIIDGFGTAGVAGLATGTRRLSVPTKGADRFAISTATHAGTFTNGANFYAGNLISN